MISKLLKKYIPPVGTESYICDYNLVINSDTCILPKTKELDELDEYSSEFEERSVDIEYILDDGAHISKIIGTISLEGFHVLSSDFEWTLFLPPNLRSIMGSHFRVNMYNGRANLIYYLQYRLKNKLKEFLKYDVNS